MSGPDAVHGEMPGFFPGRPGGEHEPLLDMIFDRRPLPPGAPPEMHDLARMLAAVAGPAEPGELAGEATALAAFARRVSPVGISPAASRSARRRLSRRPGRARLPMAAALVTAAAGLSSIAAAYVGVLPAPIQQVAHVTVGAPAPPYGSSRRPAAVANPRPKMTLGPGISVIRPAHSAASTRIPGSTESHWPRYRMPLPGPGPVASCIPEPGPTQSAVKASPTPSAVKASPTPSAVKATPTTKSTAKPSPTPSPLVTGAPVGASPSPAGPDCPYFPEAGPAQMAITPAS
jgi:hypothetical protein